MLIALPNNQNLREFLILFLYFFNLMTGVALMILHIVDSIGELYTKV